MFKRFAALALLYPLAQAATAQTVPVKGAGGKDQAAAEVKKRVERFGVGIEARVTVKLRNGSKMKGFIDSVGDDHFYLVRTDERLGTAAVIAYADVSRIEGRKSTVDWRKVTYTSGMGAKVVLSFLRSLRVRGPISSHPSVPR